ncbi:MAG: hypothetical protein ACRDBP_15855 [Luteolibacter sp.]
MIPKLNATLPPRPGPDRTTLKGRGMAAKEHKEHKENGRWQQLDSTSGRVEARFEKIYKYLFLSYFWPFLAHFIPVLGSRLASGQAPFPWSGSISRAMGFRPWLRAG